MRFLLATHEFPPFRGGVARYCQEMAQAVVRRGHRVTVLAPSYGEGKKAPDPLVPRYTLARFPGETYSAPTLPRLVFALWRAVRSQAWDCIHLCDWPLVIAAAVVQRWHPFDFSMTIHGTDVRVYRSAKIARLVNVARTLGRARQIVGNSSYTAELFRESFPDISAGRVTFAHLGVGDFWRQRPERAEIAAIRQEHGIAPGTRCVISVARWDRRKGQSIVLQALGCLPPASRKDIAYLIVGHPGEPAYAEELRRLAGELKVDARFLTGLSDVDVRGLIAGSELFLLPGIVSADGKVEGFGLAYLEAAALGVPSIASNYAAVPEVVKDQVTGLLVAPGSIVELTEALAKLLDDSAILSRLATGAREFAGQFSWERCAQQTYQIYDGF